jgi:hypothetical protein
MMNTKQCFLVMVVAIILIAATDVAARAVPFRRLRIPSEAVVE